MFLQTFLLYKKWCVFVGKITKVVRDKLWLKIQEHSVESGLMIYSFNNEQGYNIEMFGESKRYIKDFDGVVLICRKF